MKLRPAGMAWTVSRMMWIHSVSVVDAKAA